MRRTEIELRPLLLSSCLCAASFACGDIGDAQVPLPIHDRSSSDPRASELLPAPVGAEARARAVVSVRLRPAPEATCPLAFEAQLPEASATSTLVNGRGPRAVAGTNALISCRVAARPDSEGAFAIETSVLHPGLSQLVVTGELGGTAAGTLGIELTARDRSSLTVSCPSQALEIVDGAVWFRTVGCQTAESDARVRCELEVEAIFENCQR